MEISGDRVRLVGRFEFPNLVENTPRLGLLYFGTEIYVCSWKSHYYIFHYPVSIRKQCNANSPLESKQGYLYRVSKPAPIPPPFEPVGKYVPTLQPICTS